ncbi:MAG: sigma 54-interacting transcriptional regulator [SAR324 cluster bacterium]|nr:sigma 54-interacting transcriptional regulator [SAR324 cluster bacterium]
MGKYTILVIEDEKLLGESIQEFLSQDFTCILFETAEAAQIWLKEKSAHLIVSDIRLPGQSGVDFLQWIQQSQLEIPVILITAYSSVKNAVDAIKKGAVDYISKPLDLEELDLLIRRALQNRQLYEEVSYHRQKIQNDNIQGYLVGESASSQQNERIVQRLVAIEQNTREVPSVLIVGETGTGKGQLAKRLHQLTPRAKEPFIEFNCTAVPETMFESELFGHEKGAFTGAATQRIGLFEVADQGTLFIDEIGHSSLSIQAKLLKAIEDKRIRRVGGNKEFPVNIRLIVATNLDLEKAINEGTFREDLYHRLAFVQLKLEPLRERPEDIPNLAQSFLVQAKKKYQCFAPELSPENTADLLKYPWPGNLRELRNEIERSVLLYDGAKLDFSYLEGLNTATFGIPQSADIRILPPEGVDLSMMEKQILEQALIQSQNNVTQSAKMLQISRDEMRYRIEKYEIDHEHLRGWSQTLPEEGLDLESLERTFLEQALERTKNNVTSAARLLNVTRDTMRYRIAKYDL